MSNSPVPVSLPPDAALAEDRKEFSARLRAARDGAKSARGELLQRCRGYLLAAAMRRMPPALQAKIGASDLAQETLAQAYANFDRFHGASEGELLAWLGRIMEYSLYAAERRYRKTGKRDLAREFPLDEAHDSRDGRREFELNTPPPDRRAAAREERERLLSALESMDPADREIIELRNLRALSFVEIARCQGRTSDAVRKQWGRALQRLAIALNAK